MYRNEFLALRIEEVFLKGHWVANTNYREQLSDLDWQQATRPIGSLNTIARLVFHVSYYVSGLVRVFDGGTLDIRDKYSFDLPPIESPQDWEDLVVNFLNRAQKLSQQVANLTELALDDEFVEAKYGTNLQNLEALIEHSYYHLGQIVLLKKLLKASEEALP